MRRAALFTCVLAACSSPPPALQNSHGSGGTGGSGASGGSGGAPEGQTTEGAATAFPEGTLLDGTLGWQGYAAGSDALGKISLSSYLDPDGKKGIHALLVQEISVTCPACKATTTELPGRLSGGWSAAGVEILQLVILDPQLEWAAPDDAKAWKDAWEAPWAVAADPSFSFSRAGTNKLPVQVLIDPKTLEVVKRTEGYQTSYPELEALVGGS